VPITGTEAVDSCDATTSWSDSADMTLSVNTTTFKEGTGSLNLTKDGTASASASTSKTTTSLDFTSKELSIWVYVADQTTLDLFATSPCFEIRFGSDSSNYYFWQKDKADFSAGWNLFTGLTSANADGTTGSPTIGACDYTFIQVTSVNATDVWIAGKVAMDDIKLISSDDYVKIFETSYPSVNYTTNEVTYRVRLATTQANGYSIQEVGFFNTDGTPLMDSADIINPFSKTDDDELIFVAIDKLL
jgi:hypothetical protein